MAETMTPSEQAEVMTDGQIDKLVANYRAMLVKHRAELGSKAVQHVLGQPDFASEQVGLLRRRVEAVSNMIVRRVKVDRSRTPQQAIDATGRAQYTDRKAVDSMPQGDGGEVDVYFFPLRRFVSEDELAKELDLRGLKPDPIAQAAINQDDPAFADDHPNGTHWKDADSRWCFIAFRQWRDGERGVDVDRSDCAWDDRWWFGGVRK